MLSLNVFVKYIYLEIYHKFINGLSKELNTLSVNTLFEYKLLSDDEKVIL